MKSADLSYAVTSSPRAHCAGRRPVPVTEPGFELGWY